MVKKSKVHERLYLAKCDICERSKYKRRIKASEYERYICGVCRGVRNSKGYKLFTTERRGRGKD